MGNADPELTYIYHTAAVVFFPRVRSLAVAAATGFKDVVGALQNQLRELEEEEDEDEEEEEEEGGGAADARLAAVRSAAVRALSDVAALVAQQPVRCFGAGSHVYPMPLLELATSPTVLELAAELPVPSGGGGPQEALAASVVRGLARAQVSGPRRTL
jgi:hypothetical protein